RDARIVDDVVHRGLVVALVSKHALGRREDRLTSLGTPTLGSDGSTIRGLDVRSIVGRIAGGDGLRGSVDRARRVALGSHSIGVYAKPQTQPRRERRAASPRTRAPASGLEHQLAGGPITNSSRTCRGRMSS